MSTGPAEPRRRLPVTPVAWDRLPRQLRGRIRPPSAFPLAAPTWPTTVPRPAVERELGADYDTDWARRPAARYGRAIVQDLVAATVLQALAAPTVDGLDRIAHLDEPVIFAANHASHLDAPLLLSVIPQRWRAKLFVAGAADYFFDTRLKATASAFLLNAVPVERQKISRASTRRITELLDAGWSMLIFPEGGRSPDGWGRAHQPGAAWLAARTNRAVIPVHVEGTRQILAKGSSRIRPGRTHIAFGRPLRPDPATRRWDFTEAVEAAIAELADELGSDWYSARLRAAARATPPLTGPDSAGWRRAWALGRTGKPARSRRADRWPWRT